MKHPFVTVVALMLLICSVSMAEASYRHEPVAQEQPGEALSGYSPTLRRANRRLRKAEKGMRQSKVPKQAKQAKQSKSLKCRKSHPVSERIGLSISIDQVMALLRAGEYASRIGAGAPVYLAAVLEFLLAELLELALSEARSKMTSRIVPRHITLAVKNDEEFNKLLGGFVQPSDPVKIFRCYVSPILAKVDPTSEKVSKKGKESLGSYIYDIFERIATEAGKLATFNKKATLSSREIQTAVRLILPGELAKFAVSEGTKAVTKFSSL